MKVKANNIAEKAIAIKKFANANYKIDAIDRHNRRHPDAKIANESTNIEILQ